MYGFYHTLLYSVRLLLLLPGLKKDTVSLAHNHLITLYAPIYCC